MSGHVTPLSCAWGEAFVGRVGLEGGSFQGRENTRQAPWPARGSWEVTPLLEKSPGWTARWEGPSLLFLSWPPAPRGRPSGQGVPTAPQVRCCAELTLSCLSRGWGWSAGQRAPLQADPRAAAWLQPDSNRPRLRLPPSPRPERASPIPHVQRISRAAAAAAAGTFLPLDRARGDVDVGWCPGSRVPGPRSPCPGWASFAEKIRGCGHLLGWRPHPGC